MKLINKFCRFINTVKLIIFKIFEIDFYLIKIKKLNGIRLILKKAILTKHTKSKVILIVF